MNQQQSVMNTPPSLDNNDRSQTTLTSQAFLVMDLLLVEETAQAVYTSAFTEFCLP
jgi:hypothetical protein